MMPQLSDAFGLSAMGVASMVGLFYYGYSPFSLVAGVAMDRIGAAQGRPIGAARGRHRRVAVRDGQQRARKRRTIHPGRGRRVRARGRGLHRDQELPASRAATLIGATQMFGMAGGSAGQFMVGPLIGGGLPWTSFWIGDGSCRPRDRRAAVLAAPA